MLLIEQKEAVEGVRELFSLGDCFCDEYSIVGMLNRLPTQEIIRCKDCKHHWVYKCMDSIPKEICDLNQTFYDAEVDFCSLAEKRKGETK